MLWRPGAKFHGEEEASRDIGVYPEYRRATVLLSDEFRYFGRNGTTQYKDKYPHVSAAVEQLGQGHRVNHVALLRNELMDLQEELWDSFPAKQVLGRPTLVDRSLPCNVDDPCRVL